MHDCFKQPQSYNIKIGDTILKPDPVTIKLPRDQAEWLIRLLAMSERQFANASEDKYLSIEMRKESLIQAAQCLHTSNTIQNHLLETPQ